MAVIEIGKYTKDSAKDPFRTSNSVYESGKKTNQQNMRRFDSMFASSVVEDEKQP